MAAASSPALESAPAVTTGAPSLQGPGCSWGGAADLHSLGRLGRSVLAVLGPPGLCLSQGEAGSWAVSLAPWALGPALLDSRSCLCSRLSPQLPPSPSELLLVGQPPQGATA